MGRANVATFLIATVTQEMVATASEGIGYVNALDVLVVTIHASHQRIENMLSGAQAEKE